MGVEDQTRATCHSIYRIPEVVETFTQEINENNRVPLDNLDKGNGVGWSSCMEILTRGLYPRHVFVKFLHLSSHAGPKTESIDCARRLKQKNNHLRNDRD